MMFDKIQKNGFININKNIFNINNNHKLEFEDNVNSDIAPNCKKFLLF